jgi:DNA replication protein DnaC
MLNHTLLEQLRALKLTGMADCLTGQLANPEIAALSFEQRLGLMIDHEQTLRANRRTDARLKNAKLKLAACVEDIDYTHPRGLDRAVMSSLIHGQWIGAQQNLILIGATGTGKSFLANAFTYEACRQGYTARYLRFPQLTREFHLARADGSYDKLLSQLAKTDLLAIDDFALAPLTLNERHDLMEIMEDRYQRRATLIASQLSVDHWHTLVGDPTLADAILDRLVHNAHKIHLKGESMRKRQRSVSKSAT